MQPGQSELRARERPRGDGNGGVSSFCAFHALAHIDTPARTWKEPKEKRANSYAHGTQCPFVVYTAAIGGRSNTATAAAERERQWQSTASRQPSSVSSHQSVGLVGTNIALSRNMGQCLLSLYTGQASKQCCVCFCSAGRIG